MKKNLVVLCAFLMLVLSACSISQAIQLKNCEYQFSRISDVTFLDMTRSERFSFMGVARITQALLGRTDEVPLGCTAHIRVTNPNKSTASVDRVFYTVALDSLQIAEGSTTEPFIVAGQSSADLALKVSVDIKKLLQSEMRPALVKAVKNFLGMNESPSQVTITLKPIIRVGGTAMSIPKPIVIRTQYGGKAEKEAAKVAAK